LFTIVPEGEVRGAGPEVLGTKARTRPDVAGGYTKQAKLKRGLVGGTAYRSTFAPNHHPTPTYSRCTHTQLQCGLNCILSPHFLNNL